MVHGRFDDAEAKDREDEPRVSVVEEAEDNLPPPTSPPDILTTQPTKAIYPQSNFVKSCVTTSAITRPILST